MTAKREMHDYTDRFGDKLDVTRITPTAASSPNAEAGITFGAANRHGYRVAVFLPNAEAVSLLLVMAEELGCYTPATELVAQNAVEWADRLARAIAPAEVLGANPWANAIDYANRKASFAGDPTPRDENAMRDYLIGLLRLTPEVAAVTSDRDLLTNVAWWVGVGRRSPAGSAVEQRVPQERYDELEEDFVSFLVPLAKLLGVPATLPDPGRVEGDEEPADAPQVWNLDGIQEALERAVAALATIAAGQEVTR